MKILGLFLLITYFKVMNCQSLISAKSGKFYICDNWYNYKNALDKRSTAKDVNYV